VPIEKKKKHLGFIYMELGQKESQSSCKVGPLPESHALVSGKAFSMTALQPMMPQKAPG